MCARHSTTSAEQTMPRAMPSNAARCRFCTSNQRSVAMKRHASQHNEAVAARSEVSVDSIEARANL